MQKVNYATGYSSNIMLMNNQNKSDEIITNARTGVNSKGERTIFLTVQKEPPNQYFGPIYDEIVEIDEKTLIELCKAQKTSDVTEEAEIETYNVVQEKNPTKKELKKLGFNNEEAYFILDTLEDEKVAAAKKEMIKNKINLLVQNKVKVTNKELDEIYTLAFQSKSVDMSLVDEINNSLYDCLRKKYEVSGEELIETIEKIDAHNVMDVWMKFKYEENSYITNPIKAVFECSELEYSEREVQFLACRHIFKCIEERAEKLGVQLPKDKLLSARSAFAFDNASTSFYFEYAKDSLRDLIWELYYLEHPEKRPNEPVPASPTSKYNSNNYRTVGGPGIHLF